MGKQKSPQTADPDWGDYLAKLPEPDEQQKATLTAAKERVKARQQAVRIKVLASEIKRNLHALAMAHNVRRWVCAMTSGDARVNNPDRRRPS